MPNELELVDSSPISKGNQVSLPKRVRALLNKEHPQVVGYYKAKNGDIIIR